MATHEVITPHGKVQYETLQCSFCHKEVLPEKAGPEWLEVAVARRGDMTRGIQSTLVGGSERRYLVCSLICLHDNGKQMGVGDRNPVFMGGIKASQL